MKFIYKGETPRPGLVASYGPCTKIVIPKNGGQHTVLEDPAGFPVGQELPYDFTDTYSLFFLENDPRFEQVV
jgi:hypothetical protein